MQQFSSSPTPDPSQNFSLPTNTAVALSKKTLLVGGVALLLFLTLLVLGLLQVFGSEPNKPTNWFKPAGSSSSASSKKSPTTYAECAQMGYPVQESYPGRCIADGQTFVQEIPSSSVSSVTNSASSASSTASMETYYSANFPNLKITYSSTWKVDKQNQNFPNPNETPLKDEKGKGMISGVITLTKGNYQVVYRVVPVWDFGGYGPGVVCAKKDTFNKYIQNDLGRVEAYSEGHLPAGIKYIYTYVDNLQSPDEYKDLFNTESPISIPGKPEDNFACYIAGRETGAGLIVSEYYQNGAKIKAVVTVSVLIQGENRDEATLKEIDQMVLSSF
jgi:hypothetical protein